jgi:flavin reductase (DIM6/NTAB) family NADH-FMN oxidoreductase RutF
LTPLRRIEYAGTPEPDLPDEQPAEFPRAQRPYRRPRAGGWASPKRERPAGRGGEPLLTDALAVLECEIVAEHPTGDHWIVVGRVDNLRISPIKDPLLFFAGPFR